MVPLWGLLGALWLQGALGGLLGSPLRVAQCRAQCVHTFASEMESEVVCTESSNCNTCWEQCQRLGTGWSAACDQQSKCEAGCRQACRFHLQQETQRSPVLVTRGEEVIMVTRDAASWPPPATPGHSVFVVMCRLQDNTWTQMGQTLELSWTVPSSLCETVRVMVVGEEGLVTVYSPAPRPLQDADIIMRSVGRDMWSASKDLQDNGAVGLAKNESSTNDKTRGWNLREVSLIHQGVLVIAEVSWEPQTSEPAVYLVTWQLQGGGLKGSLLTDSTCVTLSLWPDTLYHIQVQLVREPSVASESLALDTRQAPLQAARPSARPLRHPGLEAVVGALAALLLFGALALLLSSRRASAPLKPTATHLSLGADHFKLFPPPVRLLLEPTGAPGSTGAPSVATGSTEHPPEPSAKLVHQIRSIVH